MAFDYFRTTLVPAMQRECSDDVNMAIPKTGDEPDDNPGTVIEGSLVIPTRGTTHGKNNFPWQIT